MAEDMADIPEGEIPVELPAWVKTQKKTFTRWTNSHLKKKSAHIDDIDDGFSDGLNLMILINVLYDVPIPRFNKNAKMRAHLLDNVSLAVNMVEHAGVKLHFVKPINILDKNLKLTLGMIWTIIHDYQIRGISIEDHSAKEGLLLWCQRKTKGYKNVDVVNFSTSWRSGLAFAALIHAHRPDLISYDEMLSKTPEEVLRHVFAVAEKDLGIPALLDVEDVIVERPDEKSVMTYVSEYFHRFAAQSEQETAGRRVTNFLAFSQQRDEMIAQFLAEAQKLSTWATAKEKELQSRPETNPNDLDYVAARALLTGFYSYKSTEKPHYSASKVQAESLYSNLQTKLVAFGRPPYVPPPGLSPSDLNELWSRLTASEQGRLDALRENLKNVKENMRRWFGELANVFSKYLADQQAAVNLISGELEDQIAQLDSLQAQLSAAGPAKLEELQDANGRLSQAGILDNSYTEFTVEELSLLYDEALAVLANKRQLVDNLLARKREKERLAAELAELERKKEALRVDFANKANAFVPWAKALRDRLDTKGDLEEQIRHVTAVQEEAAEGESRLVDLAEVDRQLHEYNVFDNKHTDYTLGELELVFSELKSSAANKLILINNQIARRAEKARNKAAMEQVLAANDELKRKFAAQCDSFNGWLDGYKSTMTELSGDLRAQLATVTEVVAALEQGTAQLTELQATNDQVNHAGIEVNEYTQLSYEELNSTYNELVLNAKRKMAFLEGQISIIEMQRIPDSQLEEYKASFIQFDKDKSGRLQQKEFQAALQSIGLRLTEDELVVLMQTFSVDSNGEHAVTFDEYVSFLVERTQDKDSAEQVAQAFKLLAKDKDNITEADLLPYVQGEKVQWLMAKAPKKADGSVDFAKFVADSFH